MSAESRTVEVCSRPIAGGPGPATCGDRITLREGEFVDVVIDGELRGRLGVAELFPPA